MKQTQNKPQTLREWRESRGLSQAEAAELVGTNQARWSKYEHGSIPRPGRLKRIAKVTGVPVEVLAGVA
jgi:transcriptional regulator with XRE-family HTH domain